MLDRQVEALLKQALDHFRVGCRLGIPARGRTAGGDGRVIGAFGHVQLKWQQQSSQPLLGFWLQVEDSKSQSTPSEADSSNAGAQVTLLLRSWRDGDSEALEELVTAVYDELRRLARAHMRSENQRHTLGATGLVHEAWLRLIRLEEMRFDDRQHFFSMASRVMRRVLVDHARELAAQKRGGPGRPLTLDSVVLDSAAELSSQPKVDLLELNDALRALEETDDRACRIVEMRYFGGLTHDEVASVLDISKTTVRREWAFAKAFLQRELMGHQAQRKD